MAFSLQSTSPIAHKGSAGPAPFAPSVCITPPGGTLPIPIPYPTVSAVPAAKTAQEKRQALRARLQQVHYELANQSGTPIRTSQLLSSYVAIIMELRSLA